MIASAHVYKRGAVSDKSRNSEKPSSSTVTSSQPEPSPSYV